MKTAEIPAEVTTADKLVVRLKTVATLLDIGKSLLYEMIADESKHY